MWSKSNVALNTSRHTQNVVLLSVIVSKRTGVVSPAASYCRLGLNALSQ